ncbi:transposase [Plakobranchus ocellatus]|uniref:Transposase n=1 Tax=Plakobranchus ocellatus TaxID=259542 RepID=A0AAV3Y6D0_9GAST|nr:transposase [Plakobranchus ocellatus]
MAAEEWRLCADWLVRCQILPRDHKATRPDATAFDLAQSLRDGVLLCHLLNTLKPGCIDMKDFSSRPQMSQFLCMKNIRTFLQTCSSTFGIKQVDLFTPNDLFDVKDFKKVLDTLSKVSKSDISLSKYSGFPPDSKRASAEHDEDIYGNLQDLAIENGLEDQEDIYDTVYQEDDGTIYDDLLRHRRPSVQTAEPQTKRDHCIKELLETENNYKVALHMIVEHFINPLKIVLTTTDREIIFAHIEQLYQVHKDLYEKLNQSVRHGHPVLSDVFIQFKSKLLIYGDFCSNLPLAQGRIDKICENETLRTRIQECERMANEGKFRLRDLLHVPMQRVLKYHLLMRELIKNTDKSSNEREGLEKALEAMMDLSLYVNEVKRDHEGLQVIEEIQNSINDLKMPDNTSLKDYGRFQKDGELKVLSHADNKQRNRHIFLFDKVMLMCKAKIVDKFLWGETYSFKAAIVLGDYVLDNSPVNDVKKPEKWNFPFIMAKQDTKLAYTFYAKTADQRDKWKEAVALAFDNSNPAAGRNYSMYTFDKPKECDVCGKLLRGIFYQGYLCVDTQKAVHKECIGKPFRSLSTIPPRRPPRTDIAAKAVSKVVKPYRGNPPCPSHLRPPLFLSGDESVEVIAETEKHWWKVGGILLTRELLIITTCFNLMPKIELSIRLDSQTILHYTFCRAPRTGTLAQWSIDAV